MEENNERKLVGRKLVLDWGKLKIEVSKLPYLDNKDKIIFDLFDSKVLLANVYAKPDGTLEDEILGKPAGWRGDGTMLEGYRIGQYVTDDSYWKTTGEVQNGHQAV